MVNLMSVDAQRMNDMCSYLNILWSAPIQIIISLYLLYGTMGLATLAGVVVMVLLIPFNFFVGKAARSLQVYGNLLFSLFTCRWLDPGGELGESTHPTTPYHTLPLLVKN